ARCVFNQDTTAKLIHNCWDKNQQSALGQFSIGRVGQFSISANSFLFLTGDCPLYSIDRDLIIEVEAADIALRMLQFMAYTFHKYAARECLYRQDLFTFRLAYTVTRREH
ncbi:hypothetical protein, partial [Pseudomonas umsongensis]|uniref:hypothetical protein n=1 Tax=Pseudomonas umsongensis TaxID=198618 RepID=UPI00200B0716